MAGTQYKRREFVKILRKNGFKYVRSNGDHDIYKRNGITLSIPINPNALMCQRMIKENHLII